MRILLDAKDLINVVEHGIPIPLAEFAHYLQDHNARLALSYMNISEFVAPLTSSGDFLKMRSLLQEIERLPVCYIREAPILIEELRSALKSFEAGREFESIDPYVGRWDETFQYPGPSAAQMLVNYRLDEIVHAVWKGKRNIFRRPESHGDKLRTLFSEDRKLPRQVRKQLGKHFRTVVRRRLSQWGFSSFQAGLPKFSDWIYSSPLRCPGFRLNYETFHEMLTNEGDIPTESDIPDFGYINAIPYVEGATLDRRIFHYCTTVSRKLHGLNPAVNYSDYIFPNLHAMMGAI